MYFRSPSHPIHQPTISRNRERRRYQSKEYNRQRRKMIQDGIPFVPKTSQRGKKSITDRSQHQPDEASHTSISDVHNPSLSSVPRHHNEALNLSQPQEDSPDSIQEAMEEIWAKDELEASQRAAAGAVLPDCQRQAKTLTKLQDWEAACTLSTAMMTNAATFEERYWEKRVRSLEMMTQTWRAKWDGVQYWDEKRVPYHDGTMSRVDGQEYLGHVEFGRDLLDGCRLIFSPKDVDPPKDVAKVVHLFRRVMSISVDVSIGLERLGFSRQ
jgi:hypothetical protein